MTENDDSGTDIHASTMSTDTLNIDLTAMDYDDIEMKGAVPISELEQLVETWRYEYEQAAGSAGLTEVATAYQECARELEELIDDDS